MDKQIIEGVVVFANEFAIKTADTISVDEMLKDLIPGFLKNKENEIQQLTEMLEKKDFTKVKKLGHNWKGSCPSYGFHYLGEMGKEFEELIHNEDYTTLKKIVSSLPSYIKNLDIHYQADQGNF